MIRKILLFIFLIFTIAWFAIGYTLKNNVVTLIKNSESDNIKITYDDVKFSGYPKRWNIKIIEPKINFVDHVNSKELSLKEINMLVSFSLKKATIDIGRELKDTENHENKTSEYLVNSDEDIKGVVKLNKNLFKISNQDTLVSLIKSIQLNNTSVSINSENKEIFNLKNLSFLINKNPHSEEQDIFVRLSLDYNSQEKYLNFQKANLALETSLKFITNNAVSFLQSFMIDRLVFVCDEDSVINLNGGLELFANKLPQGKLAIELINYQNIVDKLVPNNILLSRKMLKTIIEKASFVIPETSSEAINTDEAYDKIEKIKFEVNFSEKGINIGSINLLELKLGEEKLEEKSESN